MDQHEKRRLDNQLISMGLPKLTDPELMQRMADLISEFPGDRHAFFRDLLNECDAAKRSEMYNAMAPRLKFKPLSLPDYEMKIAEKAGEMVSQRRMRVEGDRPKPITVGNSAFVPVPQPESTGAVATVRCHRCAKVERFHAETPAGAMIEARKAGWVREAGVNKECCAECQANMAAFEQVTLSSKQALIVTDKRRVC